MTGIAIVSPGYPGASGGVTDHTARLVRHWSPSGDVRIQASATDDPASVVDAWRQNGVRGALLQYVPFLYGRRGLSSFPERLARHARAAGIRVTVFVHEPWVPPTRLPWLVLSPLQPRQLRRLVAVADTTVTAVPAWRAGLGAQIEVLAVGSTLGPAPETAPGPALPAPVVFSPLASGLNWDWILAAVGAVRATPPLVVVGASRNQAAEYLGTTLADAAWDWRGRVSPAEALALLSRAPLVLAPFMDGITARRTSALAALSTGARVITSDGSLFDPAFTGGPTIARNAAEFADAAATVWRASDSAPERAARRAWHDARFDPATLDQRLRAVVLG